ncbi:uncharacterized protein DSM5745_03701 [Aspergillus mulundensis]|uniref:Rhodopsin domain-containing protein n=1 Tax=Aspergillus mulundensis TaxID=1810919 RepID=A0A3D8SL53_9EURO|nr:hypothetical protein DSM5745_03701 [Aspergillus mulundensis]RDW87059.1 hypothetical protein DSM5745_03701 [Aspergillus mulundensis]
MALHQTSRVRVCPGAEYGSGPGHEARNLTVLAKLKIGLLEKDYFSPCSDPVQPYAQQRKAVGWLSHARQVKGCEQRNACHRPAHFATTTDPSSQSYLAPGTGTGPGTGSQHARNDVKSKPLPAESIPVPFQPERSCEAVTSALRPCHQVIRHVDLRLHPHDLPARREGPAYGRQRERPQRARRRPHLVLRRADLGECFGEGVFAASEADRTEYGVGSDNRDRQAIAVTQASVVLAQVHYGWGTRLRPSSGRDVEGMLKTGYAADILSIVALGLSKISTCLFYEALFSQLPRRVIRTILVAMITWTALSIFLVAIRCSSDPWYDISARCDGLWPRWQSITALDIITEISLIAYSGWAVSTVQISPKKKLVVFLALGCRIVLIPLSALRLYYIKRQLTARSPVLIGAYATTSTEIYLSLSIVCQITSSLKFIIAVYEDKDGVSYTDRYARASGYKRSGGTGVSSESPSVGKKSRSYSHSHSHSASFGQGAGDRARLVGTREESEEGPSGMQILRSVQWTVEDEAIELDERTCPSSRPAVPVAARPVYSSARY